MDEFGYPIDSSDLDSDNETDDQKIQIHESESHNDDKNAERPSTSADPSPEFPVETQQSEDTSTEGDEKKNTGDAAAGTHKEARGNPVVLNEQGGSPSSSWLSVTGWLGLGKEEESVNLPEEEKDEGKESQAETSTTSVTGWLGFGGEEKTDDDVKRGEDEIKETDDSFTSTLTGWLGFGGDAKTDSAEKEEDGTREVKEEIEPKVTFRSRRMSLDLENSQLQEEEKKETSTLDWLGSGLSHTLGFGVTNQEPEHETNAEKEAEKASEEEEEQPSSGSWFGIGDILGLGKNENKVHESQDSGFKDTEEEKTTEEETLLENVDTSETQGEEEKKESDEERLEEELETKTITEEGDNYVNSSSNKDTVQSETGSESTTSALDEDNGNKKPDDSDCSKNEAATKVSPQIKLEETSQAAGGISIETEVDEHHVPKSENVNYRESGEEEIKTSSNNNVDHLTQSEVNQGPELSSVDLNSDSTAQSVGEAEDDEKDQQQRKMTDRVGEEEGDESKEEEKQERMEVKQSVKQDELKEVGDIQEEEIQQEIEEEKQQEETLNEAEELKERQKQQGMKEIQEERKQEEMEEVGKVEEINGEERPNLIEVKKEKDKQRNEELKDEEKREEVEEVKKERKQEGVEGS
nr:PREDICTED: myb-like protein X [Paralichthys olivaceus]